MNEEHKDPDTNTDDNVSGDLEISEPSYPEAVPVADAADTPQAEQPAPPAPAGPRAFPQHYTLLLGSVMCMVASLVIWERAHVFGQDVRGIDMISGSFLFAMALYGVIVAILNIQHGRLRGMMSSFITGAAALYIGIKKALATFGQDMFLTKSEISAYVTKKVIPERAPFDAAPDLFPKGTLDQFTDHKEVWGYFLGQYAPGVWWSILGGLLIVFVFLKAFMPSKKAEPAPPPTRGRRRR